MFTELKKFKTHFLTIHWVTCLKTTTNKQRNKPKNKKKVAWYSFTEIVHNLWTIKATIHVMELFSIKMYMYCKPDLTVIEQTVHGEQGIFLSMTLVMIIATNTLMCVHTHTHTHTHTHISSSSSCCAGSTDIPDPLLPLFPIVHRLWQGYIPNLHIAAEWMFVLVDLLLPGHIWGSIGVHHL